jgi:hypothetical protein
MDLKTDRWTDDGDNKGDRQINVQTKRFTDRQADKLTDRDKYRKTKRPRY